MVRETGRDDILLASNPGKFDLEDEDEDEDDGGWMRTTDEYCGSVGTH